MTSSRVLDRKTLNITTATPSLCRICQAQSGHHTPTSARTSHPHMNECVTLEMRCPRRPPHCRRLSSHLTQCSVTHSLPADRRDPTKNPIHIPYLAPSNRSPRDTPGSPTQTVNQLRQPQPEQEYHLSGACDFQRHTLHLPATRFLRFGPGRLISFRRARSTTYNKQLNGVERG
jgi:hypothetical protein